MLIGIDASRANYQIKTGVEWYAYYLIQELKKITVNDGNRYFLYTDKKLIGDLATLPENWQEKVLAWPFKYFWTLKRLSLEIFKNPPDVLFVPSHVFPLILAKKNIITLHDLCFERFPQVYSFLSRIYLRLMYKRAAKLADKIIVPSEFTKKELIDLYQVKSEKIVVIYMGYNKIFRPIKDKEKIGKILKKYGLKKPYLLFFGRLEKKKGVDILLKAFQILANEFSDIHLVLVGPQGYGYKNFKFQILHFKNIKELGYIKNEEERALLYNGAEAFVFPSLYEGFGMPILEAMACACPVIASDIEPIREITKINSAILVPPNNPEILAEKIKEVLKNQELRNNLIENGLEQVKNFSWEKCAKETLKILLSI